VEANFVAKDGTLTPYFFTGLKITLNGKDCLLGVGIDITERKQVEDALQRSEQVLQLFVEYAPAAIAMFDRDMRYIATSRRYHLDYDLGDQVLVGRSHYDVFPEMPERWKEIHRRCLAGAIERSGGDPFLRTGGKLDWVRWEIHPWYENTGEIGGIILFSEVITERRQAEEEIHRRAEELTALNNLGRTVNQTLSPETVVSASIKETLRVVQPDLAFLFLREGEKLHLAGFGPESARGTMADMPEHRVGECMCGLAVSQGKALYSRDIFTDLRCTWEECKKAGLRSFAALPLKSGDEIIGVLGLASAGERVFEGQAVFLETLAGQIAAGLRNALLHEQVQRRVQELTAIHHAGQQLRQLQAPEILSQVVIQVLEETLAYDYGAILLIDPNGDRLLPFALSSQRHSSEFIAQDKAYIISHDLRVGKGITGWVAQTGQSVCLGDVRQGPRYYALRDEEIRSELCVPLWAGEQIIGVVNVETTRPNAYTKTDQRVLETVAAQISVSIQNTRLLEQAEEHAAQLEQRVARRTAELATAKERAESADRLKSAFLATMSHELRTPLNSIIGFTGIILQGLVGPLNPEQAKQLGMVRDSANHLLNLINDILDLSKIEAGQLELVLEPMDIRQAIEKVVQMVTPLAQKKGLALHTLIAPDAGQITADRRRVEQVLINLVNNAVKFTETGSVQIEAETAQNSLLIRVTDTGIGIKADAMDKLFKAFQQVETGLSRRHEGSGLGLNICRKLVEMMGGHISAASAGPGQGSTFTVELPLTS
jgi:PAS domain S-box-containing protein